jgi:hypothetical protein
MSRESKSSGGIRLGLAVICLVVLWIGDAARAKDAYQPTIDAANFQATIDNPYFPLVPGTTFKFVEKLGKSTSENEVTVISDTKTIMGVSCRVVHDTVKQKGVLKEETYDWYAQDKQGNVWYFGEDTKEYKKKGGKYSTEGSWEAGVDGAQPGIVMPANPAIGEPYRQEYYKDQAEDMGQVVAVDDSVKAPFGAFQHCVRTKEWSNLESGSEKKWYAKGVGFVRSEATTGEVSELVSVTQP